jgi:hypothetical protein
VDRVAGASEISVQAHDVRKQGYMGVGQGGRSSGGGGVMQQRSTAAGGRLGAAGGELWGSSGGGRLKIFSCRHGGERLSAHDRIPPNLRRYVI